ncbi:MAG: hypothetical protein ACK4P1_09035, partial [Aggregatilineales bacterium]
MSNSARSKLLLAFAALTLLGALALSAGCGATATTPEPPTNSAPLALNPSTETSAPRPTLTVPPEVAAQMTIAAQLSATATILVPTLTQVVGQTGTAEAILATTAYQATLEANLTHLAATLTATSWMPT